MAKRKTKNVLVLKSEPRSVTKVEPFLKKFKKQLHITEPQFNKLLVATTEAVNNGIIHGNKRDATKKITLICESEEKTVIVKVYDEGMGVNPEAVPDPLAEENLLRENGRGIFLMRSLMDEVIFEYTPNGSAVIMRMNLKERSSN